MGVPIGDPIGFGQIFLSYGQRYGIFPLIAVVYISFKILDYMNLVNLNNFSNSQLFGFSLLYSVIFELIIYNDYAGSRVWGIAMLFIALRILKLLTLEKN
jgi:hypothetical protein